MCDLGFLVADVHHVSPMNPPFRNLRAPVRFVCVAALYFLATRLGVLFVAQPEHLAVFWPGGGLLLGYLLVIGRKGWPAAAAATLVGNTLGNLSAGHTLAVSVGFAAVNALEPVLAAWLFSLFRPLPTRLNSTADVFRLFLVSGVVCGITAFAGAGVVTVGLGAPSFWGVWKVWWLADGVGMVLFAPLVVAWAERLTGDWRREVVKVGPPLTLTAAVSWSIFVSDLPRQLPLFSLPFPVFPLLLWVTLAGGRRATTTAVVLVAGIAVWGTVEGAGPMQSVGVSVADRVLSAQAFAAVVTLSSLVLSVTLQERKRTQAALQESERRFKAIFHSQFQFIGLMTTDGRVIEANRTALAAAGVREEDVLGKPFWETEWWTHDTPQQERLKVAVARAAAGEQDRFEASHPTADGGLMWVDFSLTPFRGEDGRVVLLIPEGRDITARKRAESAVEASEALLRQFVAHAPAAIAMLDTDMRYIRVSQRWVTDYHLGGQELIGRSHYEVFPDIPERWKSIHRRVLAGAVEACEEDPFPRADGGMEWLQWEARPWHTSSGQIGGLIFFTQVITARKQAEERLRASEERLAEAQRIAHTGCWEIELASGRAWWSDEMYRLYGLPLAPSPPPLEQFNQLLHPDDREGAAEWFRELVANGSDGEREFRASLRNGTERHIRAKARAVRDSAGQVVRFACTNQDVTERKQAEAAVRESEARFRTLVDQATDAIFLLTANGQVADVNRRACDSLGYPEDELVGLHFTRFDTHLTPLAHATVLDELAAGRTASFETRHLRKDGTDFPTEVRIGRVVLNGHPHHLAIARDVTDRKQAEAALRESEERYRLATVTANVGVWEWNVLTGQVHWNDQMFRMYRITPTPDGFVPYEAWSGRVHPEDLAHQEQILQGTVQRAGSSARSFRIRLPDGECRHIEAAERVRTNASGQVEWVVGTNLDATDRVWTESALRESEERYRSVVDALAEGIVVQDASGKIVAHNRRAELVLGLTADQLVSRSPADTRWQAVREDGRPFPAEEFPVAIALRTRRPVFDTVMGVDRPTGGRTWLTVNAIPFGSDGGSVVASFHDVTESRRMHEQILASLHEKEVMLREIHHRVKNNLAVIASLFHLQTGYVADDATRRLLEEAQSRVRSMALVHEHLYNAADLGAVSFSDYADTLVRQLFHSYRLPTTTVALSTDIRPVTLPIDQAIPCGLILNELVSNALKHAFPDGRRGILTVGLCEREGVCEIRVADDGVGIPADRLEGRPKSLGLRLVRTLTRQLDGAIDFSPTRPGVEVRVTFTIGDPAGATHD